MNLVKHVQSCCLFVMLFFTRPVPAPVPRCSPWIIINKLVEWTSLWSDSNAYFPVGPCEYGGPIGALLAGDTNAVFLLNEPEKIPRHNVYELVWFFKTGLLRMIRMMLGLERFEADINILLEGYQHYTPVGPLRRSQVGQSHEPDHHQINLRQRKHPYEKLIGRNRGIGNGINSEAHVAAGSSPNVQVAAPRIETGGWKPIEKEEEEDVESVNEIEDDVV